MIVAECADVGLEDMEVREGGGCAVEVDSIVPYENIVGNFRPSVQGFEEIAP